MADVVKSNLGPVTAYADAVKHGYTGTREEFAKLLANAGNNLQQADDAKKAAQTAATNAATSEQNANAAKQAAQTAQKSAETAASTANNAKTSAESARDSAQSSATFANASKEAAAKSESNAKASATAAANSATSAANTKAEVDTLGDEKKQALTDESTKQQEAIAKKRHRYAGDNPRGLCLLKW